MYLGPEAEYPVAVLWSSGLVKIYSESLGSLCNSLNFFVMFQLSCSRDTVKKSPRPSSQLPFLPCLATASLARLVMSNYTGHSELAPVTVPEEKPHSTWASESPSMSPSLTSWANHFDRIIIKLWKGLGWKGLKGQLVPTPLPQAGRGDFHRTRLLKVPSNCSCTLTGWHPQIPCATSFSASPPSQ